MRGRSSEKVTVRNTARAETALAVVADSPVELIPRNADMNVQKALVAVAAGRCEFPGCNEFLFEHPLTKDQGNFGENAHIVAFKDRGPRGDDGPRPAEINGIDNLMLLCLHCHKNIDSKPKIYTREFLMAGKRDHEQRIRLLTAFGPEHRTNVLVIKSRIGDSVVEVGTHEVTAALRPRYPSASTFNTIDLSQLGDESGEGYYPMAVRRIDEQVAAMHAVEGAFETVKHLSVFGLAPIPLLVVLGRSLSNKVQTDFFQCHRDRSDRWTWHADSDPVSYTVTRNRRGTSATSVAAVISLSGTINAAALPAHIDESFTIYTLGPNGVAPNPSLIRTRPDLHAFRATYRQLLADIVRDHPGIEAIHVFPAVPAPAAIVVGFDLLPKVHPALIVHDFDKRVGGFTERIRVNRHDR